MRSNDRDRAKIKILYLCNNEINTMNYYKISFFLVILLIILSCDKIESPFMETTNNLPLADTIFQQKVLIEDFTGHQCGNCPRAHEKIEELKLLYGNKIVSIGIHSGFFAEPSGQYTADYRTQTGDELNNYFGVEVLGIYPIGMLNRIEHNGNRLIQYSEWGSVVLQILESATDGPKISISIDNEYDSENNKFLSKIFTEFLTSFTDKTIKLAVYIVEDSLISTQKDYEATPQDIENYVHRNVLRGAINGTWGETILSGSISAGEVIKKSYSYMLDSTWAASHCWTIAFVYDSVATDIIQVEDEPVVE